MTEMRLPDLDRRVVERESSLFSEDLAAGHDELAKAISGSRMLVIGGAGSIGSSTLRTIAHFAPATVHVIDHNENGLAELVRSLRTAGELKTETDVLTLPFGLGGDPFRLWLGQQPRYDYVLNFAALKHVRSEKDPFSVLAMLENNVLRLDDLAGLLTEASPRRAFSVSTDKAANPSSMMGATKRLMEHALFAPTQPWGERTQVSSARFANVAFSNGSLLQSWQIRLAARQPLACPEDTRRFFVSMTESGHLCTLVAFLGEHGSIAVPALDPGENLMLLSDVAARFLSHNGYEAHFTHDEGEALSRVDELRRDDRWPVLLTPLNTAGEKPYEEFVGELESMEGSRFEALRQVQYRRPDDPRAYASLVDTLRSLLAGDSSSKVTIDGLRSLIASVEPAFANTHRASAELLDNRI